MSLKRCNTLLFILLCIGTMSLFGCEKTPKSKQLIGRCYTEKTTGIMMVGNNTVPYTENEKYYLLYNAIYADGHSREKSIEVSKNIYVSHKEFKGHICEK